MVRDDMHGDPPDDSSAPETGGGARRRLPTGTKTLVGMTPVPGAASAGGRITERGLHAPGRPTVRGVAAVSAPAEGRDSTPARERRESAGPASRAPTSAPASQPRREGRHAEDLAFLTALRDRLLPHLEWMSRGPHRELLAALADGDVALVEELLEHARRERPRLPEIGLAAAELRKAIGEHVAARLGGTEDVPVKAGEPRRPTAAEARLLACVNGVSTIEDVLVASELPLPEAVRVLSQLADGGHLILPGRPRRETAAPASERSTLPEILAPFAADLHALGVGHDRRSTPPSRRATERPPAPSDAPRSSPTASTAPPPPLQGSLPPGSIPPGEDDDPIARALVAAASVPKAPSLPLWSVPPPRSTPPPARSSDRPAASARPAASRSEAPAPSQRSTSAPPSASPAPGGGSERPGDERRPPGRSSERPAPDSAPRPAEPASSTSSRASVHPSEGSGRPPRSASLPPPAAPPAAGASIWVKISTVASLAALVAGGLALVRSGRTPPAPPPPEDPAPSSEVAPAPEEPEAPAAAPQPPPSAAPSAPPAPPPSLDTVLLKVRVTPRYARVFLDGVLLAPTTELRVHRRMEPHQVRVEAPGFVTQEFTVRAEKDTELSVTLRKRGAPAPGTDGEDPYP